jgi:hypothetical protein
MSGESDSDFLDRLAQSIADGSSIDWDKEIDRLPPDERLKGLLDLLKVVDGVAEVHRSLGDPSQATHADDPEPEALAPPHPEGGIGQWGKLVLLRKIGEGGFGIVYHAHDPWLDHPVALKLFKPRVATREASSRILHEARKLARIRHPNIVTVHGADSHNGQVGFWMDLIEGTTLEHVVLERRLSAGEATHIGREVCRALAAVHLAGIVHRDVKAQNVMRATDGGRIILMDFGAGEFMADPGANARKQGTPLYLAPELFNGGDGSARSDIYSTGVLLYHLVTGDFPVPGASIDELVEAHRRGDRRRLRDVRPDLPDQFVSVVERALDPDPERRYESAGDMEIALAGDSLRIDQAAETRRITLQNVSIAAAASFAGMALVGWIACRVFDFGLGVHSDFAARPADYLSVGAAALLPFGIVWSVAVGVFAVLVGLGSMVRAPLARLRGRLMPADGAADGATVATVVLAAGFSCWLALTWYCADLFRAMIGLTVQTAAPVDPSALGSAGNAMQRTLFLSAACLSFLLALAVWRWFPKLERTASDPSRVRSLQAATIVVASLAVVIAAAPRRLVWERFEVVKFENRSAFVIGTSSDELLLYYPYTEGPKQRRVRRDIPSLQRNVTQARLFDPQ